MKIIISTVFVVLLVSIAQAGIFTTSPVSSTVWTAQSPQTITWINDNKDPPLAQLTNVKIELMTGQQQQVSLLTIGDGIQGTALKFDFQQGVPTNLGPSGQFYFLKFSNGASYTGFSARFTINGINGTLPNAPANNTTAGNNTTTSPYSGSGNSTSGSTGGSTSGSTSGSTGGSSGSSSANSTSTTSSTKPTATATSSNKPSSTNKTSGANSLGAVHVATFVIALVGLIISNWI